LIRQLFGHITLAKNPDARRASIRLLRDLLGIKNDPMLTSLLLNEMNFYSHHGEDFGDAVVGVVMDRLENDSSLDDVTYSRAVIFLKGQTNKYPWIRGILDTFFISPPPASCIPALRVQL
jgi:hypothetical protein